MNNPEMKLNGSILTKTVDISKEFGRSSSGMSIIIGSTEGNVSVPEKEQRSQLKLIIWEAESSATSL